MFVSIDKPITKDEKRGDYQKRDRPEYRRSPVWFIEAGDAVGNAKKNDADEPNSDVDFGITHDSIAFNQTEMTIPLCEMPSLTPQPLRTSI